LIHVVVENVFVRLLIFVVFIHFVDVSFASY